MQKKKREIAISERFKSVIEKEATTQAAIIDKRTRPYSILFLILNIIMWIGLGGFLLLWLLSQ
jgi:hypothetical protein